MLHNIPNIADPYFINHCIHEHSGYFPFLPFTNKAKVDCSTYIFVHKPKYLYRTDTHKGIANSKDIFLHFDRFFQYWSLKSWHQLHNHQK